MVALKAKKLFDFDFFRGSKGMNCGGSRNSAVSHSGSNDKSSVTLQWRAPSGPTKSVDFKFTVVQSYSTYWVGVPGATIKIQGN